MKTENYRAGEEYEAFIKNARLCERNQFGADSAYMENLMNKEVGKADTIHLSHKNLLSDVKMYMTNATWFAITRDLEKSDYEKLRELLPQIEKATTSTELLAIAKEGRELVQKYIHK
jgi:hypothetical protein